MKIVKGLGLILSGMAIAGCSPVEVSLDLPENLRGVEAPMLMTGLCEKPKELFKDMASVSAQTAFLSVHIRENCIQFDQSRKVTVSPGIYYLAIAYSIPDPSARFKYRVENGMIFENLERGYWQDRYLILNNRTIKILEENRDGVQ